MAVSAAEPVALTNPGFEEGLTGWIQASSGEISVDEEVRHGGEAGLQLSGQDNQNPWVAQGIAPVQPLAQYQLAAFARGAQEQPPAMAAVKIEFYDAHNENISGYYGTLATAPDGSWQQVQVNAPADETAAKAAIIVRLLGPGTVWFDDVEFSMVQPPPPVVVKPQHLTVPAAQQSKLALELKLTRATKEVPAFHFHIHGPLLEPETIPVAANLERANDQQFEAILNVPELSAGVYELVVADENKHRQGSTHLVALPIDSRSPNLSAEGELMVDDQPFFPIGLYHVNMEDCSQVAAAGFNCIEGPATDDAEELKAALDAAAEAGLKVVVPLFADGTKGLEDRQLSPQWFQECERHPAVLILKMVDEPDLRPDLYAAVAMMLLRLRASPITKPLQITVAHPAQYERWAPLCDVLEVDPYPLPNKPLSLVSDFVSRGRSAVAPDQGLMALLQAGWSVDLSTQPTVQQARTMMYLALMDGAQGIFWYCLRDPGWDLTTTPLWEHFPTINEELATLGQVAVQGAEVADIKCTEKNVIVKGFRDQDRLYILMINDSDEAVAGRLRVPVRITKTIWLRTQEELHSRSRTIDFTLPPGGAETAVATISQDTGDVAAGEG